MPKLTTLALTATLALLPIAACQAPEPAGCINGGTDCVPPSPCANLTYTCSSTTARAFRMTDASQRPPGSAALAGMGDLILQNDQLTAVIDAANHPNELATTGGNILDLAPAGAVDHIHQILMVTGILPRDAAHYDTVDIVSSNPAVVVARGHLEGDPDVLVTTRYELRPCDPGLRVRTEVYNGSRTIWSSTLSNGHWYGDRGLTPFVPLPGQGYRQPPLDLLHLDNSWREFPWEAASAHVAPQASYSIVACNRPMLAGFNDPHISATGTQRTIVQSGDGIVLETMIFTAAGAGLDGAQSLALDARSQLWHEPYQMLTGRVVSSTGDPIGGDERLASLMIYSPDASGSDDPTLITPWTEVVPGADGRFVAHVPSGHTYRAQVYRLGRTLGAPVALGASNDFGDVVIDPVTRLTVNVSDADSGMPIDAEVILVPTPSTPRDQVHGTEFGLFDRGCAPYLGPPHAESPGCNRALAYHGSTTFAVPPGNYWVYATAGPNATLARQQVSITLGSNAMAALSLHRLTGIFPSGTLAGDFHVHSGRSYDITFPAHDRVLTFVTSGVDVIAATEHDAVGFFDDAIADLGFTGRVIAIPGVEETPNIPYLYPPGAGIPHVIGHVGAWPFRFDPSQYRNGAPWDELQQPGSLFDHLLAAMPERGVIQLNHPTADPVVGRDLGWFRTIGFDPRVPLPGHDDGSGPGMLYIRSGTHSRNMDWDVQEVMQGQNLVHNLQYRTLWHTLLDQGVIRGGTANSDSHSLTEEQLGYPRNIVTTGFDLAHFDRMAFDAAVRDGKMVGTNGPMIVATITDASGAPRGPSLETFQPAANAVLDVTVTAAPWIPVQEVRIVVNDHVVQSITGSALATPPDPFGTQGTMRYHGTFALADLVHGRDAWISVEAGLPFPATADQDDDGFVDHADLNGDGTISDSETDDSNTPPDESSVRFNAWIVSPGTWTMAFTNPFLIDANGDNQWTAPGHSP